MAFEKQGTVWVDSETAEVMSDDEMALLHAGQEAARGFIRYDRARLAYEAKRAEVQSAIAEQFPELALMEHEMKACKHEYEVRTQSLRQQALVVNQQTAEDEKTFLQGAITVLNPKRKTHYDAQAAHDWIVEMKRFELFVPDEKALLELAKGGLLPSEIMIWERVAETRVTTEKLLKLIDLKDVQS